MYRQLTPTAEAPPEQLTIVGVLYHVRKSLCHLNFQMIT